MLRRELKIALRAPVTWVAVAVASLLVGHGFLLALDLFSAMSRAAEAGSLMRRELDPLAGVIRPTLGGAQLAVSLLVPIVAARVLSVEKERGSLGALVLAEGSAARVLWSKLLAAIAAGLLLVAVPLVLVVLYVLLGGTLDAIEVGVALVGHVLHVVLLAVVAIAAAAWTRTTAQATVVALCVSLAAWAIDASEGFAALAWLGPLEAGSVTRRIAPFDAGILDLGALAWFAAATVGALASAWLGVRFDLTPRARLAGLAAVLGATLIALAMTARIHRAHDWTEQARMSLPPAAVAELRALPVPIDLTIWLDRDDSRRRQLERDVLSKLRLARSDLAFAFPLDGADATSVAHDASYGRIVIRAGQATRETRSTSRREIVTLLFDAAGRPLPDWSQAEYVGRPFVVESGRRTLARGVVYVASPALICLLGWSLRRRRGRS